MLLRRFQLLRCRWISTTSTNFIRNDQKIKFQPKNSSKTKNLAFPHEFDNKLNSWASLIGCEIEENLKSDDEYITTFITNLGFKEYTVDPIHGHMIDLVPNDENVLPTSKFSIGMPVRIEEKRETSTTRNYEGILKAYADNKFRVTLRRDSIEPFDPRIALKCSYSLCPSEEFSTYQTLQDFMKDRDQWKTMPGFPILQYVYRVRPMKIIYNDRKLKNFQDLNECQKAAVNAAMNKKRPIVCIQGPPGTGKTQVLAEIILQANRAKQNVLVCAVTHQALENLMNRVGESLTKIYRLSHGTSNPAKTLDAAIEAHSKFDVLVQKYQAVANTKNAGGDAHLFRKVDDSAQHFKTKIKCSVLREANIVFSTLSSASVKGIRKLDFIPDLVVIEEASQPVECATWVPILQAPRAVLSGDVCQLGPIIRSERARAENFGDSLMKVIHKEHGRKVSITLKEQYRMNWKIQKWSSDVFYGSKLQPHESVKDISLADLSPNFNHDDFSPMVFINTHQITKSMADIEKRVLKSFSNQFEAELLVLHLRRLLDGGLSPQDIGIITPYSGQVKYIKELLGNELDPRIIISSVDAFQGDQREAMIMSFVRNNMTKTLGFVADSRRMNVSMTRAKRHMCIIGNSKMFEPHHTLSSLYKVFQEHGKVFDAMKYLERNKPKTVKRKRVQRVR